MEAVDSKLLELSTLLPDLVHKLDRLKATLVLALVRDTGAVAAKLVGLRGLLPSLDLSRVFSQYPHLLLDLSEEQVAAQLEALRCGQGGREAGREGTSSQRGRVLLCVEAAGGWRTSATPRLELSGVQGDAQRGKRDLGCLVRPGQLL